MQEQKPTKIVVVPARPPIDKLVAYKRILLDQGDESRLLIEFCDVNEPTDAHFDGWRAKCSPGVEPYLIDVGKKKYHNLGSSAAQVEKLSSTTESGVIFNRLVELVNENNRTGFLKNPRHSIAKILRDAYHVMNSGSASQEVVFDHGMDVVNAFFFHQNKREWDSLFSDPQYLELKELWKGFAVMEEEVVPFTVPLYFKQLFMSGRSEQEINTKIGWWLYKVKSISKHREVAKEKKYRLYDFAVQNKRVGIIHVGNYFEAAAATYQFVGSGRLAVGIIGDERGHVHIQTSIRHKVDVADLFAYLNEVEPGLWYYEQRFRAKMILNGSPQFTGVTPTSLTPNEFRQLALRLIKFPE
jgi:hypothetical protein